MIKVFHLQPVGPEKVGQLRKIFPDGQTFHVCWHINASMTSHPPHSIITGTWLPYLTSPHRHRQAEGEYPSGPDDLIHYVERQLLSLFEQTNESENDVTGTRCGVTTGYANTITFIARRCLQPELGAKKADVDGVQHTAGLECVGVRHISQHQQWRDVDGRSRDTDHVTCDAQIKHAIVGHATQLPIHCLKHNIMQSSITQQMDFSSKQK